MAVVTADIVVVGLGAMGAATLYQLARRGARPIGIDQFAPPHEFGSSHGETRITRQAIGEGEAYVPLALRSHEIWRDIQARTGVSLLVQNGCLLISNPSDRVERPGRTGFLQRTVAAARRFNIPHEVIASDEIRKRYPQFRVADEDTAYFEPGGGYLRPEACVEQQLQLAEKLGATLRLDERVMELRPNASGGHVDVVTPSGTIQAGEVVVAAGAWTAGLLGPAFAKNLLPTRQVLHWFEVDPASRSLWESALYLSGRMATKRPTSSTGFQHSAVS